MSKLQRLMFVEDDPDIREIVVLALSDLGGLDVVACASGEEALALFPETRPQMIVLDVMMPGMDGPATLSALRNLPDGQDVPALFMTAKAQTHELLRYRTTGSIGVVVKPFDPMTLAAQVRAFWEKTKNSQEGDGNNASPDASS